MSERPDRMSAAFADIHDAALLDQIYGLVVVFTYSGCASYSPRQQLEGVVLDLHTTREGKRQLLIKADRLNVPKWIDLADVQFPAPRSSTSA